jgi:branched-chain amino acid transport system permease protein
MSTNRWLATGNYFTSYQDEQRIFFTHLDRTIFTFFLLLLFAWPLLFTLSNKYMLVLDNILIAMVAIIGLNIVTGFAGLISIGHAAFVGIGAYTVASFSRTLGDSHVILTHAWPLMIVIAGLMGAIFGAIVGLPAMRLKHLYLAIATLSFQMIFSWTINFLEFFNQGQTIAISRVFWFTGKLGRKDHYLFWYYVILVVVILSGFMLRNLLRTRYGRCLSAVRDNDRAADAMGMHPGLTKVYAFGLAGFLPVWPAPCTHTCIGASVLNPLPCITRSPIWPWPSWAVWERSAGLSGGRPRSSRSNSRWKPLPNTPVRYCRRTGILPPL